MKNNPFMDMHTNFVVVAEIGTEDREFFFKADECSPVARRYMRWHGGRCVAGEWFFYDDEVQFVPKWYKTEPTRGEIINLIEKQAKKFMAEVRRRQRN